MLRAACGERVGFADPKGRPDVSESGLAKGRNKSCRVKKRSVRRRTGFGWRIENAGVRPMRQIVFCRVAGKLSVTYIKRVIPPVADVEKNAN